eukprot:CAMPEP_0115044926 /NCGR_PEP_ID=MMETSP0216-20121206/47833_1 /TAXON_ID=223996 /ORGANISM="Protocruzia adherens, Strain Boccale" /LENGTH=249 /DNA_ID=CAMNT_0002427687 /DNA_START=132 /DNA_END=877 /DNA_ORIENTATION=+
MVVKSIFKRRWWWSMGEGIEDDNLNCLWSQLLKKDFMATIPLVSEEREKVRKLKQEAEEKEKSRLEQSSEEQAIADRIKEKKEIPKRIHNHVENHPHISNKKALYMNMRYYYQLQNKDVFEFLPVTYHVTGGINDPEFKRFEQHFLKIQDQIKKSQKTKTVSKRRKRKISSDSDSDSESSESDEEDTTSKNIWIVKPGENTNRGRAIEVYNDLRSIKKEVSSVVMTGSGERRSYIIQKYIERPLLVHRR